MKRLFESGKKSLSAKKAIFDSLQATKGPEISVVRKRFSSICSRFKCNGLQWAERDF